MRVRQIGANRSVRVLTALAERHPGATVAVVTHGGFLAGFLEFVLKMPAGGESPVQEESCER